MAVLQPLGVLPFLWLLCGNGPPTGEDLSIRITWADPESLMPNDRLVAEEVSAIFEAASVDIQWQKLGLSPPDDLDLGVLVILRPDEPSRLGLADDVMGVSYRGGRNVFVFFRAVASSAGWSTPRFLPALAGRAIARVVAHEVVHALAPSIPHADSGVLAKRLTARGLAETTLGLDRASAEALREELRGRQAAGPAYRGEALVEPVETRVLDASDATGPPCGGAC